MTHSLLVTFLLLYAVELRADQNGDYIDPAPYLARQEFMETSKVEAEFGNKPFVASDFRRSTATGRGAMSFSLVKNNLYVGKSAKDVVAELGPISGHFWNDTVPAYLISEPKKKGDTLWQLVFLLDKDGHVVEARINKNCCHK